MTGARARVAGAGGARGGSRPRRGTHHGECGGEWGRAGGPYRAVTPAVTRQPPLRARPPARRLRRRPGPGRAGRCLFPSIPPPLPTCGSGRWVRRAAPPPVVPPLAPGPAAERPVTCPPRPPPPGGRRRLGRPLPGLRHAAALFLAARLAPTCARAWRRPRPEGSGRGGGRRRRPHVRGSRCCAGWGKAGKTARAEMAKPQRFGVFLI